MSSFGEDLKRERELRKISLREIAETTKINVRYLDALENNEFKRLPGGVFNKGFVRAYAQHIGVDEEDLVNAYLLEEQAQGDAAAAVGEPLRGNFGDRFTGPGEDPGDDAPPAGGKRMVLAACAVLVIVAILVAGWMLFGRDQQEPARQAPAEAVTPPAEEGTIPAAPAAGDAAEKTGPPEEAEAEEKAPPRKEPEATDEPGPLVVEITLVRPTSGRLNCDNRQVELLDRLAAGITLGFRCDRFLLMDAEDGGALLISRNGGEAAPAAGDGVPLRKFRLTPGNEVD